MTATADQTSTQRSTQRSTQPSTQPSAQTTETSSATGRAATASRPVKVILPRGRRTGGSRGGRLLAIVPPLIVAAIVVGIWYLVSYYGLSPTQRFILPAPHDVIKVGFLNWTNLHEILLALRSTATVALIAFVLSSAIGMVGAVVMSEAKWAERSFFPFAVALQTIPFLALVPLVGFWFGYNEESRIIIATLASLFPITTNALHGLQSGDAGLHDLLRLHTRSRVVRLIRLRLPAALPSIFTGLRISAGLCVLASVVTDFFIRQGQPGIGGLLQVYSANLQSEQLYACLLITCAFGLLVFWLVNVVRKLTIGRWEQTTASHSEE
jgi:NitT/TauT family transport system permease protein